jgi:hypothetical protein
MKNAEDFYYKSITFKVVSWGGSYLL